MDLLPEWSFDMNFRSGLQASLTLALLLVALFLGSRLWHQSLLSPWTRDGRIQADVIHIAADSAGLVQHVEVYDNQFVHRGDVLLRIDAQRYQLALQLAQAHYKERQADLKLKREEFARRNPLVNSLVSAENVSNAQTQVQESESQLQAAAAQMALAQLNRDRTWVRAPVDGYISNLKVHPGDYATTGQALMALIDSHSFTAYGYFEETKIAAIHIGDPAHIQLMSGGPELSGHVESLAYGITDRDNTQGRELLADVNPTFSWVRLAQRIPVRIHLDHLPTQEFLAAGMTCTIIIQPHPKR